MLWAWALEMPIDFAMPASTTSSRASQVSLSGTLARSMVFCSASSHQP